MALMRCGASVLLAIASLSGAQAGEVCKGPEKLSESEVIALLVNALKSEDKGKPLDGITFRYFRESEFYDLVCTAQEILSGRWFTDAERKNLSVRINCEGAGFQDSEIFYLAMPDSVFNQTTLEDVRFKQCNLARAQFKTSQLVRVWFLECDLTKGTFNGEDKSDEAKKKKPTERRSKVSPLVSFNDSTLDSCDFRFLSMEGVEFLRCSLSKCEMSWAKFEWTNYDPLPNSLPFLPSFGTFEGLPEFSYQEAPTGMSELRNAFKSGGLRREERQVTAALCRQQMRESGRWEGLFKRVFFDLPSAFGMFPGRPLRILLCLCGVFTLPYAWAILRRGSKPEEKKPGKREGRIWQVPLEKRVLSDDAKPRLLHVDLREEGFFRGLCRALGFGFFFSLISAFGVGYRDLDVGRWIERINPEESTLRATGWLRTVSGVQGLMSFYLLALWLLTYFGRPFE
jgi:Pentapeptide repeats (8 copies)